MQPNLEAVETFADEVRCQPRPPVAGSLSTDSVQEIA
jgi:hypothetical protein